MSFKQVKCKSVEPGMRTVQLPGLSSYGFNRSGCARFELAILSLKNCKAKFFILLLGLAVACPALAVEKNLSLNVAFITRDEEPIVPLSLLDLPIEDDGFLGAELGLKDNQTTGEFLGHEYILHKLVLDTDASIADQAAQWTNDDLRVFVADLQAIDLIALADAVPDALIFNARAPDDELRNDDCRSNVLHVLPSRAMLTDALAQYLAWKRWTKLVIATGRHPQDQAYTQSMKRAAKRFNLRCQCLPNSKIMMCWWLLMKQMSSVNT